MNTLTQLQTIQRFVPAEPRSIEETGLNGAFLSDLALKIIYTRGFLTGHEIAEEMALPFVNVTDRALEYLRRERLAEVKGSGGLGESSYQYVITDQGRLRARELMSDNTYASAAPVPLEAYIRSVQMQSLTGQQIPPQRMREALKHLVIGDEMLSQIGPAVNSAKSMFLYGAAGNGKTALAEAIGNGMLPGNIFIPHAISAEGHVIKMYDPLNHVPVQAEAGATDSPRVDKRWLLVKRPFIAAGGELTLEALDLVYDPSTKFYEAPYQMKANGGVFLIDDFGRQHVRPRELLNRWIMPLDKRIDFLTLATGRKLQVPFDAMIIFSTNLNPSELVDEAFMRRIRYKIAVNDPSWEDFREIFLRACRARGIEYNEDSLRYLITEYYIKAKRPPRAVHPRDLLDEIVDVARYKGVEPKLTNESLDQACQTYFVNS